MGCSRPSVRSLGVALLAFAGAAGCAIAPVDGASPRRVTPPTLVAGPSGPVADRTEETLHLPLPGSARRVPVPGSLADEWTWVDEPESLCANGSPTGFAVNVHPGAKHLVMFLEGGGACSTGEDCWVNPTAIHIATGYALPQLESEPHLAQPLFQRGDRGNPFADASYVFVPYCTGDLHAGSGVATYPVNGRSMVTYHFGARNLDLYLQRLSRSFPDVDHVWLVGASAGGFGTLFNLTFVARAFGVRTDVIDDSGPGIGQSGFPASWQVRLPADCDGCAAGLEALFLRGRSTYPETRFAFLSFEVDTALPAFYGASQQQVVDWLGQYEQSFAQLPNTRSFVAPGSGHVVMGGALDDATRAALSRWLVQMAVDDPAWGDYG